MSRLPRPEECICPDDGLTLILFQPDETRPARLLACCRQCHEWFQLVESGHPSHWAIAGRVPIPETAQAAG